MLNASGQTLKPLGRLPVTILVNNEPMLFPFLDVKTLSVPLILRWDFQKEHVRSILPGEGKMQFNHGYEAPVLERWIAKVPRFENRKDRIAPSALTLFKPVLLSPCSETKVMVTIRATGQCLFMGRKDFLANSRLYMAHGYHRQVERLTPFFVLVANVSRKPVTLAKGTRVGVVEPYRDAACPLSTDELLSLQRKLKIDLSAPFDGPAQAPEVDGAPGQEQHPSQTPNINQENVPPELKEALRSLHQK